MNISQIFEKLNTEYMQISIKQPEYTQINRVKLYKNDDEKRQCDILYIVESSEISDLKQIDMYTNIIFINDNALRIPEIENASSNLLIVSQVDPICLLENIMGILADARALIQHTASIADLMMQGRGIQPVLDKASEILHKPIFLDALGCIFIACSINKDLDDYLKEKIVNESHDNFDNLFDQLRDDRKFEKVNKSKTPVYISGVGDCPFVVSSVIVGDSIEAFVIVYECEKKFTANDLELIAILSKIIALEMPQNTYQRDSFALLYEPTILSLLSKSCQDSILIASKIKQLNKEIDGNKYLLTIEMSPDEIDNTILPYIRYRLESIVRNCKIVTYRDHLVMIMICHETDIHQAVNLEELSFFLSKNHLYAGISRQFTDFGDLWIYFDQSIQSIDLGLKTACNQSLFFYQNYALFHIFSISEKHINLKTFCHQIVLKLLDHDRKNNTDFTKILFAYLENNLNQVETASALHIYRRTVSYKIEKINDIINIDFSNKELVFHLYISCKILTFIGELTLTN